MLALVTVGEDAQSIKAPVDDGLLTPELSFKQTDGPIVRTSLDEGAPAFVILAKKLLEAIEREEAGCLAADFFQNGTAINLLRSVEIVPMLDHGLLRRRPDPRKSLLRRLAKIVSFPVG